MLIIIPTIYKLKISGFFGLHIEIDMGKKRIYAWYKNNIIGSDSFHLDNSIEEIQKRKQKLKEESLLRIEKIKEIKSKV